MKEYTMGIELGSTRIKAVLIDEKFSVAASGVFDWENRLEGGYWTYDLARAIAGLQKSCANLLDDFGRRRGGIPRISSLGISAMMHGYLVLDDELRPLVPFRTWRNTTTERAAAELTELFGFNIPQRWSVSHLYQALLNGEPHVWDVALLTTLSGYVHALLTGERVLGINDASGMFPVDPETKDFDSEMLAKLNRKLRERGISYSFEDITPRVLCAGEEAGTLTEEGARLLDPSGRLQAGIPLCPPEGDAGTGMIATDSIGKRTGNVSAGTSVFAMVVLERPLSRVYPEIDIVTTPDGSPVAMVHGNNCTSDINAWADLLGEAARLFGGSFTREELFSKLFQKSLEADSEVGGLVNYNYISGEPVTGCESGRPLFARSEKGRFDLANFMRAQIYSALGALRIGMEILERERVAVDRMCGHGGFFKTPEVGQRAMSAAVGAPVSLMENAGEGGAWGIALLAAYLGRKEPLSAFLEGVFAEGRRITLEADEGERTAFNAFMRRYRAGLCVERLASETL